MCAPSNLLFSFCFSKHFTLVAEKKWSKSPYIGRKSDEVNFIHVYYFFKCYVNFINVKITLSYTRLLFENDTLTIYSYIFETQSNLLLFIACLLHFLVYIDTTTHKQLKKNFLTLTIFICCILILFIVVFSFSLHGEKQGTQ